MKVVVKKDYTQMSRYAAELIARQMIKNPEIVLGLATGSTPVETYRLLVEYYKMRLLDFSKVKSFNLDEYVGLDPTHKQSYHSFMNEHLFNHVNIKKENVHLLDGQAKDIHKEMKAYEEAIKEAGGIDVQLLGIGKNAHIGFNEPGTAWDSVTSCVNLTSSTIEANSRFFKDPNKVPKQALSVGIKNIMQARKIILLASGMNKRKAVWDMIKGPITKEVPASILQLHPKVVVIIDEDAAQEGIC